MSGNLKSTLLLVAGCCAGSLAVGLIRAGASRWLSQELSLSIVATPASQNRQAPQTAPTAVIPSSSFARTPDGRLIHPLTKQACPKDMKPIGRKACVGYCEQEDM